MTVDARDKMLKKNEDVVLPETFLKRWMLATNKELTQEAVDKDFDSYRDEFKWQLIKGDMIKENSIKVEELPPLNYNNTDCTVYLTSNWMVLPFVCLRMRNNVPVFTTVHWKIRFSVLLRRA